MSFAISMTKRRRKVRMMRMIKIKMTLMKGPLKKRIKMMKRRKRRNQSGPSIMMSQIKEYSISRRLGTLSAQF